MHILVLNSAHGKYPVGSEGWIQATLSAFRELSASGVVFIASTEPSPWDIASYIAGRSGDEVRLIVKRGPDEEGGREYMRLLNDLDLNHHRTKPLYLPDVFTEWPSHPKDAWQKRDRCAVEAADLVFPISIRPGGRLDSLLRETEHCGKVRNDFRIPWTPEGFIPRYSLAGRAWRPLPPGSWLIHWTRASQGKWPGERTADFIRDLLADGSIYVRNAPATLRRILAEGRIRGSSWKTPGGVPATAFSALSPGDALSLMRWRKRYVRPSFEPYGIAVRRETLAAAGAREVRYAPDGAKMTGDNIFFTHAPGPDAVWTREREWRLPGDLDLAAIPVDDARIVVPDEQAAEEIEGESARRGFPVHVLFG